MFKKQIIIGSLLCLIASMSWGAMFPVAHLALQQIDPFFFAFIRYLAVSVLLVIILLIKEGKSAFRLEGRGKALLFYGTMAFTVYNMAIFLGQSIMGEAGTVSASIMEVLMPMISVVLLWILGKNRPPKYTIVSIVIALAGALLVITNGKLAFFKGVGDNLFPLLLMLIAVAGWVIYSMGGSRFEGWSVLRYSTLTCLLGTAVSFVIVTSASAFRLISVPDWHTLSAIKFEMAFMVLLPGLAALLCWNAGIKRLSALNGILFINFVPITTFIVMAFQGYHISSYEYFGTLLVIYALVRNNVHQRSQGQQRQLQRTPIKKQRIA